MPKESKSARISNESKAMRSAGSTATCPMIRSRANPAVSLRRDAMNTRAGPHRARSQSMARLSAHNRPAPSSMRMSTAGRALGRVPETQKKSAGTSPVPSGAFCIALSISSRNCSGVGLKRSQVTRTTRWPCALSDDVHESSTVLLPNPAGACKRMRRAAAASASQACIRGRGNAARSQAMLADTTPGLATGSATTRALAIFPSPLPGSRDPQRRSAWEPSCHRIGSPGTRGAGWERLTFVRRGPGANTLDCAPGPAWGSEPLTG